MPNVSYKSCTFLKKKSIYTKYLCLLSQKYFFPGLSNLGDQIRSAKNRYIAVQTDLKYPLVNENYEIYYFNMFFEKLLKIVNIHAVLKSKTEGSGLSRGVGG